MSGDYQKIQDTIVSKFIGPLTAVFGSDLSAVLLYGSAARGSYRRGVSDINVLIILKEGDPRKIAEAGQKTAAFRQKCRITPLIMTGEEFFSAADVFPLEYQDIMEAHTVLYGTVDLEGLSFTAAQLRHQMEEKLRGAVGDIRRMLLAAGKNQRLLGRFLVNWSGVGNTLFRGLLRLRKITPVPQDAAGLLDRVSQEYGVSVTGFSGLNRFRNGGNNDTGRVQDLFTLADSLLDSLGKLTAAVDAMVDREL
jgi:hypothetical protein